MRVVLGDLSWKILPEPRDYAYAHFLGEELPNKDKENTMIEEVCTVVLHFCFIFYCCFALCNCISRVILYKVQWYINCISECVFVFRRVMSRRNCRRTLSHTSMRAWLILHVEPVPHRVNKRLGDPAQRWLPSQPHRAVSATVPVTAALARMPLTSPPTLVPVRPRASTAAPVAAVPVAVTPTATAPRKHRRKVPVTTATRPTTLGGAARSFSMKMTSRRAQTPAATPPPRD